MSRESDDVIDGGEVQTLLDESAESLYEDAPVAYMSSRVGGTILKVNRTLEAWTSYTREELVGTKRLHDLLAPGARIYYETHYAPLLQMQGEVRAIALELVRADGTRLPVLMSSTLVESGDGRTKVVRTTFFDASERRRYERELLRARADAEMRARSAVALDHVDDGVVLVDPQGRVEVLNAAAERILGVAAADVAGRDAASAIAGWTEIAAADPRTVVPIQRVGAEQWLSVVAADAGDGIVYTIRDVTAERRLDRLRDDLVAVVSHELRTPLTGVFGAATTLLARGDGLAPETRQTLLEMVVDQTQRLAGIVDQILLASRLDNDNVGVELGVFDVDDVFTGLSLPSAAAQRVVIDSTSGTMVRADLDLLRQIVANLVDNAIKYSDGPVHVRVEPRELSARITVADEGPGIPPDEQRRIFEKFYRLDPAQRSGVTGTGLGLYIARELADRIGGRVGLLQRSRGSTFYVDVPLA